MMCYRLLFYVKTHVFTAYTGLLHKQERCDQEFIIRRMLNVAYPRTKICVYSTESCYSIGTRAAQIDGCTCLTNAGSTMTCDVWLCLLANVADDIIITNYVNNYDDFSRACHVTFLTYFAPRYATFNTLLIINSWCDV